MSDIPQDAVRSQPAGKPRLHRAPVFDLIAATLVVGFLAVGTWSAYWADLRNDQYQLINLGRCVYDGGRLYVDCWENKPPGIAWMNALGYVISRGGSWGVWILPGVTALLSLAVLGLSMGRLLSPTAAGLTVVLAAVVMTLRLYDSPSINPDFYSMQLELSAGSLWLVALQSVRPGRRAVLAVSAGLLWAAATCVKQTGCVGLFAVSLIGLILLLARHTNRVPWFVVVRWTWLGFVVGAGGVTAVLAYQRTLPEAWEAIVSFNVGPGSWEALMSAVHSWRRVVADLAPMQLPLWLGFLGILVTLGTDKAERSSPAWMTSMVLWWLAAVLLALMGPSRAMRYWQATWPPMLWLAGAGLLHVEGMYRRLEKGYRSGLIVVSLTLVIVLGRPLADHYQHGLATTYLSYSEHPTQRERLEELGRQVRERVPEGQRIYVWSYDAGVYVYSSRAPASRFTYPRSGEQMSEILTDLAAGKAYAILVPDHRAPEFERFCDQACHSTRDDLLTRYTSVERIANYRVWVRQDPEGSGSN